MKFEWDNNKPFLWKEKEMTDSKKSFCDKSTPLHEIPLIYAAVSRHKVREKQIGTKT